MFLNRKQPGPIRAGGRAAERVVQSQRAHRGEEDSAVRAAEADPRERAAGVGRALQDHPAAPAGNHGRQRGTHTLETHFWDDTVQICQAKLLSFKLL